jgi:hypothetical protein
MHMLWLSCINGDLLMMESCINGDLLMTEATLTSRVACDFRNKNPSFEVRV